MSTSDMLQAPPNCILYCVSQVPAHVSPRSIARRVAGRFLAHPQLLISNGHDPWASSTSGGLVAERAGRRGELGASRSSANSTGEIACWPGSEHVIVRLRQKSTHIRVASVGRMMKLNAAVFLQMESPRGDQRHRFWVARGICRTAIAVCHLQHSQGFIQSSTKLASKLFSP